MSSSHPVPPAAAQPPAPGFTRPAEPTYALVAHYTLNGIEWKRLPVASLPVPVPGHGT